MFEKPQAEHHWLDFLTGEWNAQMECITGPDQPPQTSPGVMSGRMMGGMWAILESEGEGPDGKMWKSIITLGYNPAKGRYIGTFVAEMMTHMWHYSGVVDMDGKRLVLDTEGPKFDGGGGMTAYQDIFEKVNDNHWTLTSQIKGDDGAWNHFMTAHYRRK